MSGNGWRELDRRELETLGRGRALGPPEPPLPAGFFWRLLRRLLGRDGPSRVREERYPHPPEWRREPPEKDLFGLALSGGGIRSATFSLGLLQALQRTKLLGCFDYLSTVSGGGYVGGFWSAWLARRRNEPPGVFPGDPALRARPEPGEIRHLRVFGNFLRPRLQLLSLETGRIVAVLVGGILPCVLIALAVVLAALLAWWGAAWLLAGERPGRWVPVPPNLPAAVVPGLVFFLLTLAVVFGLEWVWRRRREEEERRARGWFRIWAGGTALLAGLLWALCWNLALPPRLLLLPPRPLDGAGLALQAALQPLPVWLLLAVLLVLVRGLSSRWLGGSHQGRARLSALDRILARTVLCAAAWGVIGSLWVLGQVLAAGGVGAILSAAGTGAAGGGAFGWVRRLLAAQANKPTGGRRSLRALIWLIQALAYLTLAAVTAAAAALLVSLYADLGNVGLWTAAGVAGALLLASGLFDPHEIGLHAFYRNRLVRAYLGASNLDSRARSTAACKDDDLPLTCLAERPLHLVCCAANDLAGDPLGSLHRGAESAVLSRLGFQLGDRWERWADGAVQPTLGDVMTASAAAFNSHMGKKSMPYGQAATFVLTAIGLRLGLWIENPERRAPGGRRPNGYLFLRELLGLSKVKGSWIHLSDGAHFENLALYELVRRHCRFILLSDCGADPDRAFDDFGNAVRRVREDFGVEIQIDISPLQPDESGRSRQPMVAGDIRYPPATAEGEGDVGILLYVKPTLTGDEPADVAQYAGRNARFPHETTIDQFYDEAQWESYRRLGEHVIQKALRPLAGVLERRKGPDREVDPTSPERIFLRARYYWPPLPPEEPLLLKLGEAWARLEDRLGEPALEPLRLQLSSRPEGEHLPADPPPEAMLAALPAIREAIRLMEATFLRTGFGRDDRTASHERYMGWLNRFGTWVTAPIFQRWWPWLAPTHARDFTRFLEETFHLGVDYRQVGCVREAEGEWERSARERWEASRSSGKGEPERTGGGPRYYGFFLKLEPGAQELHAGLVEVRRAEGDRGAACWTVGDFVVRPGLWGLGVGEAFLEKLVETLEQDGWKRARVDSKRTATAANDALYTGAGFMRDLEGRFVRTL